MVQPVRQFYGAEREEKTQKLDGSQTVFSGSAGNYLVGRVLFKFFRNSVDYFMKM